MLIIIKVTIFESSLLSARNKEIHSRHQFFMLKITLLSVDCIPKKGMTVLELKGFLLTSESAVRAFFSLGFSAKLCYISRLGCLP